MRRGALFFGLALIAGLVPIGDAGATPSFSAGARGIGDPYYPLDGNGGYDVQHYGLQLRFDPATDRLEGVATITATATQNLSAFNFDFDGLTVRSITVEGESAKWNRARGELTVRPPTGIADGSTFVVVVRYDGVPQTLMEFGGPSGFMQTEDGAVVIGQPHVASTWFPANDHPIDKATFSFWITAPADLEVVSNGVLEGTETSDGWTTWRWEAAEPMVTYLAAMGIGRFDLRAYEEGSLKFWDAVDEALLEPTGSPRTGVRFALSQSADSAYKRLTHTFTVPAGGSQLSFWADRDTEPGWDYFFVEAHTVGQDDWTTLPDLNGHTSRETNLGWAAWLPTEHPFLQHYVTCLKASRPCTPTGTTGEWWGATGSSDGYEHWTVDLSAWSGETVEVSLSVATDSIYPFPGVFVDDVETTTGVGSTSFEADGDPMDGWTVPGAPPGSPGNANDWIAGIEAEAPPSIGVIAGWSLARQAEILEFEAGLFGPYPFAAAGGVVDDGEFGFALEVQTRPFYSPLFFNDPTTPSDFVVVHELAHQWVGDSVAVERWSEIWLNEGFATYAEWLWSEDQGMATAQEIFDDLYTGIPADDPFWSVVIGDPGPDLLFDGAVYYRGGMTLHQLRLAVGDADFFQILEEWSTSHAGGNVTTDEFIALAETISGQQLDELFQTWLFMPSKPELAGAAKLATAGNGRATMPMFMADALSRLRAGGS